METFVLVTGAWHGGWTWRPVATRLRAAGHRVLTPTLPGLGLGLDDDPRGVTLTDTVATFTEAPNQKRFFALDVPSASITEPTIVETPGSHEANSPRPAELTEAILAVSTA